LEVLAGAPKAISAGQRFFSCVYARSQSIDLRGGMVAQSAECVKRRRILEPLGATMTTATQRAGLVTLLALTATTTLLTRTTAAAATEHGYPAHYCVPITADSSDDQKVYCEGWRVIRKGW
jgi:hypothetical protein